MKSRYMIGDKECFLIKTDEADIYYCRIEIDGHEFAMNRQLFHLIAKPAP